MAVDDLKEIYRQSESADKKAGNAADEVVLAERIL